MQLACNQGAGRGDRRAGSILVLFVIVFTLLAGMVAVMLDGGRIFWEKRLAQNAADAGAMAGAQELRRGHELSDTEVRGWISHDAEMHGFEASEVAVIYPPEGGSFAGLTSAVEVQVTRAVPLTFMRLFGQATATVRGRAVAGLQSGADACVIALDNTENRAAFKVNGNATLNANCGLMANSTDASALENTGTGSITATWVGVTGGFSGGGATTPAPTTGVPPMLDPFATLPAPDSQPAGFAALAADGVTTVYSPGTYSSRIKITGGAAVFLPGIYILEKGLEVTGGTVTGSEVFFYNENASGNAFVDIGGNAEFALSAPTSGTYKGVLFFNNRDAPDRSPGNRIARGNSNSYFEGTLYFPSQHLDWAGNPSGVNKWSYVVANTINISGTADDQVLRPPDASNAPPALTAVLFQ